MGDDTGENLPPGWLYNEEEIEKLTVFGPAPGKGATQDLLCRQWMM